MVAKLVNPHALDIVGIATEPGSGTRRSEDLIYLDTREWTPELQAEAQRLQAELGLLKRGTFHESREKEYPEISYVQTGSTIRRSGRKIGRNEPCPCGSQRKYKRCCGQ
jgi:preprotein translocase subunit SecA